MEASHQPLLSIAPTILCDGDAAAGGNARVISPRVYSMEAPEYIISVRGNGRELTARLSYIPLSLVSHTRLFLFKDFKIIFQQNFFAQEQNLFCRPNWEV